MTQLNLQSVTGASKSPSVGVFHVSACSSCHIQAVLPRNQEITHNGTGHEAAAAKGVSCPTFLDTKASLNATLVILLLLLLLLLLGISSLKMPKAFLTRSGAQRNFADTFVLTFPTDLPSQIFKLISN